MLSTYLTQVNYTEEIFNSKRTIKKRKKKVEIITKKVVVAENLALKLFAKKKYADALKKFLLEEQQMLEF